MSTFSSWGQDSSPDQQPVPETLAPAPEDSPIRKKLKEIIIPSIDLQDTPILETIAFLRAKSIELDHATKEPARRGVNMILLSPAPGRHSIARESAADRAITAELVNIPLGEALNLVAQLAGCKVRIDEHAVILLPLKPGEAPEFAADDPDLIALQRKTLSSIILPLVDFVDTPLPHALDFITQKSMEHDPRSPAERGFNLISRPRPGFVPPLNPDIAASAFSEPPRITLNLKQIPVLDALQYTAALADMELIIGNTHAVIQPRAKDKLEPQ